MKLLFIFAAIVTTAFGYSEDVVPSFNMDKILSPEDTQKLEELLELNENKQAKGVVVTVLINEWIDKILANARTMIVENGMDPISIPDQKVNIKVGHTTLVEGQLKDTSSLARYENATFIYDNVSKQFKIQMTLRFEDLKFIYKYHTKVTLISMTGHVHGKVEHVHINVGLKFDFSKLKLFVDTIDFKHTGSISLKFTGIRLVDWVTNAMSSVLTTFLHSVILNVIKGVVSSPINAIVDFINQILHPTSLLI